jgi:hypothetical protein
MRTLNTQLRTANKGLVALHLEVWAGLPTVKSGILRNTTQGIGLELIAWNDLSNEKGRSITCTLPQILLG